MERQETYKGYLRETYPNEPETETQFKVQIYDTWFMFVTHEGATK